MTAPDEVCEHGCYGFNGGTHCGCCARLTTLEERLALAEAVCLMYGWSPARDEYDREKAATELWRRWHEAVPAKFLSPKAHPELDDAAVERLAAQRDERRKRTLGTI